jgi:hypothetical protein
MINSNPCQIKKMGIRRVQAQGIQVFRLIYLSEEEFAFIKLKRLEFLKRAGYFRILSNNRMSGIRKSMTRIIVTQVKSRLLGWGNS